MVEAARALQKASLAMLQAKYRMAPGQVFGAKGHATGYAKPIE